ncbi:MAG: hypothetical protein HYV95_09210 [Opitutae bacterium]|nr:hypothetical protein [Opitutae bacterium]
MSPANIDRLRSIKTLSQLVAYLRDVLDWPIESGDADAITFDYQASELGLDEKAAVRIKEIKQLRPLASGQPWGIFFINFEKKRLPVVVMRRILRELSLRKRESANKAERQAWQTEDLLFISAYGEDSDRALTFAHFVENPGLNLSELRVLGWDDDDTPLKLDYVVRVLGEKLRWQDTFAKNPRLWRTQWSEAFRIRHGHVIRTSAELAIALAVLARRIRARVSKILEMEAGTGEIRTLQRAFRIGLIHDLDDAAFADMFAQTITYGLFSLACRRTHPGAGTAFVKDDLSHYFTSPFLKEMLGIFLGIKSRKGKIDFDELGISDVTDLLTSPDTHMEAVLIEFGNKTRGEDPVVHFYEDFLSAYNKQLKVQRGVFYTPQPVVSYIVRSVHELLQTEFGLADGLADTTTWGEMVKKHPGLNLPPLTDEPGEKRTVKPDEPFVQILDPATGTATFIVEVIDVVHRHLEAKWKQQRLTEPQQRAAWNAYVPQHLLPRLHAFELMMAPYAIAHMKVGLKLAETGYQFAADERARIYLTNALEPKVSQLPQLGFDALAREAAEVNEIKWYKRFTVVIGNPPYSALSANLSPENRKLVDRYRSVNGIPIRERSMLQFEKNIQDDYIKFFVKAQKLLESGGAGLLGFVTNHSYLDGPTLRGMRASLMATFPLLDLVDLHGNSNKKESLHRIDENVFDIQQGVAVALLRRHWSRAGLCRVGHLFGTRMEKYDFLSTSTLRNTSQKTCEPKPDVYHFIAFESGLSAEYLQFSPLGKLLLKNSMGTKTGFNELLIDYSRDALIQKIGRFAGRGSSASELKAEFGAKAGHAALVLSRRHDLCSGDWESYVKPFQLFPFDYRWAFLRKEFLQGHRFGVMENLSPKHPGLVAMRQTKERYGVFVAAGFCGHKLLGSYDSNNVFPVFDLSMEGMTFLDKRLLHTKWLSVLFESKLPDEAEILSYFYSVLNSPGYRSRYAEFLKIDFPRLPLTGNRELFHALARLGGELIALHLLESPRLDQPITVFIPARHSLGGGGGGRNPEVEKVSWSRDTVWVDKAQTTGFQGVREDVWNFHIGGYQVCEKWLKDRKGRTLTKVDIAHYHKIVVALSETIRLMAEIDKVIEKHGGWPGAFATASTSTPTPGTLPAKAPKPDLGLRTEDELPLS